MNQLPLLYIHSSTVGTERANSVHAFAMVRAMANISARVTLIAPKIAPHARTDLEEMGVSCIDARSQAPAWLPKRFALLWVCYSMVWRGDPQTRTVTRYLPILLLDAVLPARYIVYDLHMPPFEQSYFIDLAFRAFVRYRSADVSHRIVAISKALADIVKTKYNTVPFKVCHDAAEDFRLDPLPVREARAPRVARTAGFAGSLTQGKGFDLLIEIAKATPTINFIVAGKIPHQKPAGIPSNVELRGFLSRDQLSTFYSECAITLVPNQIYMQTYGNAASIGHYNSPLKLFEGMSAETAIVASDIANLREVLDEQSGLFCDPNDHQVWSKTLHAIVEDTPRRHAIAKRSREIFKASYTWEMRVKNMLGI